MIKYASFAILILMSFGSFNVMLVLALKFVALTLAYLIAGGATVFQVVGSYGMLKSPKITNTMALLIVAMRVGGVAFMILVNMFV